MGLQWRRSIKDYCRGLAEPKQAMTLGTDTYDYDVYVIDDDRGKIDEDKM